MVSIATLPVVATGGIGVPADGSRTPFGDADCMIERSSPTGHAVTIDALVERGERAGRLCESDIEQVAEQLALDPVALEGLRDLLATAAS